MLYYPYISISISHYALKAHLQIIGMQDLLTLLTRTTYLVEFNDEEMLPVRLRIFRGLSTNEIINIAANLTSGRYLIEKKDNPDAFVASGRKPLKGSIMSHRPVSWQLLTSVSLLSRCAS